MKLAYRIALMAIAVLAVASCGKSKADDEWALQGKIEGAAKTDVVTIDRFNTHTATWYALDTISLSSDGSFQAFTKAAMNPDIFRLTYNGKSIYFPVDSTETISIASKAGAFDTDFTLDGSESAQMMMKANKLINTLVVNHGVAALDTAVTLKRQLGEIILQNPTSVVAYYLATKSIDGTPVFNPAIRSDRGIIGAVANSYNEYLPGDPRTGFLKNYFLEATRQFGKQGGATRSVNAELISIIDVELPARDGKNVSLADIAEKNKVVILNFTDYTADFSNPLNIELRKVYDLYHDKGLEIYQAGVAANEYLWGQAAANQPWLTLFNPAADTRFLKLYNVASLPAIFIIANGEIAERVTDLSTLSDAIGRYIG